MQRRAGGTIKVFDISDAVELYGREIFFCGELELNGIQFLARCGGIFASGEFIRELQFLRYIIKYWFVWSYLTESTVERIYKTL